MKEFFGLLVRFNLRGLFIIPTKNGFIQFFRYAFVGGIASIIDWGVLYILNYYSMYYLYAAVFGFIGGLLTNFILAKMFVFKVESSKVKLHHEFIAYAVIGLIGLGITLALMFILTDFLNFYFMFSKIIATLIVLIWNYMARKVMLYDSKH